MWQTDVLYAEENTVFSSVRTHISWGSCLVKTHWLVLSRCFRVHGVGAPLFQRGKKTTPRVFVRCPCYSDSTQQKVWVTASYDGHRGLREAQERWHDTENSGSVHEPTKACDSGPPPGPAFLTGLMSPLWGHLAPAKPACWSPLSVLGTGTPAAGLCLHSSVFLQTLAQTIPSPPSSLDSPWSPQGFHLTHHLTCNLPLPWPPIYNPPLLLSRTCITFKHRHIYSLYLLFIVCLFLLEFNCTERSVLLITPSWTLPTRAP